MLAYKTKQGWQDGSVDLKKKKTIATKPDGLSSVPGAHVVEIKARPGCAPL